MANTNIQLGEMDFNEIRTNIKTFMETQGGDIDFDFNGSIAATILDLLAYNTMYYAFYSNMLINESFMGSAQRIESIISLVKPFGYAISHRQSASVNAELTNTSSESIVTYTPYENVISGSFNGVQYNFYYVDDIVNISPLEQKTLTFYQANSVNVKQPLTVDYDNQAGIVTDKTLDTRTLRLYVQEADGEREYTRINNTDSSVSSSSRVYYLETTNDGYKILFGSASDTDGSRIGRGIGTTESAFISYLSTSGSVGNGIQILSSNRLNIALSGQPTSAGGYNQPNLESIKFLAPRQFSSQGNLVSVSDYQKEIIETLPEFSINQSKPENNISVYGGTDTTDGTPGFVYFSLYGENGAVPNPADVTNILQNKIPVGVSLEYNIPTNMRIVFRGLDSAGQANLTNLYFRGSPEPGTKGFNQTITTTGIGSWSNVDFEITPFGGAVNFGNQHSFDLKNDVIDENIYADGTTLCARGISSGVDFLATWNSSTKSFYINGTVSDENKIGGFDSLTNSTKSELYFDSTKYDSLKGISGNFNISVGEKGRNTIIVKDEVIAELVSG